MRVAHQPSAIAVGARVFVHPNETRAPLAVRGSAAMVTAVRGAEVQLRLASNGEQIWVDVAFLQEDRRRKRQPVDWAPAEAMLR